MATVVPDTSNMRQAGAGRPDYFEGYMGKPVVYEVANVTNGQIMNVGWGARWCAWENYQNTTSHQVAAILANDQVTFETDGTRTGRLWVFYAKGVADGRTATAGQTHPPDGIVEVSRDVSRLRMVVWDCTAVVDVDVFTPFVTGVRHHLWRANGAAISRIGLRFASPVAFSQATGKITFRTGGNTVGKIVFLIAHSKGLDAAGN